MYYSSLLLVGIPPTIITDFGKYYIICLFHFSIGLIDF